MVGTFGIDADSETYYPLLFLIRCRIPVYAVINMGKLFNCELSIVNCQWQDIS